MKRKPASRVVAIRGRCSLDVVTQAELAAVSALQAAEWQASQAAHKAVFQILTRLQHGAEIEAGTLEFDPDLRMVRSKKTG